MASKFNFIIERNGGWRTCLTAETGVPAHDLGVLGESVIREQHKKLKSARKALGELVPEGGRNGSVGLCQW